MKVEMVAPDTWLGTIEETLARVSCDEGHVRLFMLCPWQWSRLQMELGQRGVSDTVLGTLMTPAGDIAIRDRTIDYDGSELDGIWAVVDDD